MHFSFNARLFCSSVVAALLATFCPATGHAAAATRADAEQDTVLKAMLTELNRNQNQLQLDKNDKPYFLEFRIDDVVEYHAKAAFGALTEDYQSHSRIAHVRVRVGDYKFDNSHAKAQSQLAMILQRLGIGGDGMISVEVVDQDPVALRYGLWTATDIAYKLALADYASKQTELKTIQSSSSLPDDLSKEKPIIDLEPLRELSLDREAWKKNIAETSGLVLTDPSVKDLASEVQTSDGTLMGRVRTEYLVNSEGTILRKSLSDYHAEVAFSAQAPDGMHLERSVPLNSTTAAGLGEGQKFHESALHALTGLHNLCKAPLVTDEYHGPVLLSANASARSIEDLLPRAVLAHPPALGATARTVGPYASSYQTRVMPDFLTIVDDPTLSTYENKALVGAYQTDDEGVPAQKVTLVESGKLVNYLIGRDPVRDFPVSNGHGRAEAGRAPNPRIGVIEIESSNKLTSEALTQKLIELGKSQGLAYVYLVQALGSVTRPRTLERIQVSDGKRELVRGGQLEELNLRAFRTGMLVTGDQPFVYNMLGDVPATVISPAFLFSDLTIKRAEEKNAILPYYPAPK